MKLELDEVRRLTGPNLLWNHVGVAVDVFIDGFDKQQVAELWQAKTAECLESFAWSHEKTTYRLHQDGANLAMSAPLDTLYTACELAELAWDRCVAELVQSPMPDWQTRITELKVELAEEQNPKLVDLMLAAQRNGVSCLVDDDDLSIGMGNSTDVWPVTDLPMPNEVNWTKYSDIPRAYITGTNGKSTSVRLAAEIASAASLCAGVTSTDFIRVGQDIIDRGDYSGPSGARILLRDKRAEIAFLEVARGGMLRRGLPVDKVDAALITNVASDHLGQYGINTVQELAEVKFLVSRALDAQGVLVVNADDELVIEQAMQLDTPLCWFSVDQDNALIKEQIESGGRAVFVRSSRIIYHANGQFDDVAHINDLPMTFNGSAMHNVQNALGVVGLCRALNLPLGAIAQGLSTFGSNAEDNPGRGNLYSYQGAEVIVDFAHNEHSMHAVVSMVKRMPARRRIVMFSHAGDRSDQDIIDLTQAVLELDADLYIVAELEDYLRGRELGDLPKLVSDVLHTHDVKNEAIYLADSPLSGAQHALAKATPGDVILLFVLDQRDQVHSLLSI
ncbi:MAG: cyanophycin synthetase [Cryomorphaceae bacterium]|jgi:cyanophycin synthetase